MLIGRGGEILEANAGAAMLRDGSAPLQNLLALAMQVQLSGESLTDQILVIAADDRTNPRRFDVSLMPWEDCTLVFARESTFEANLIRALKSSRELFRDLALCSADFAFEVDPSGTFVWVSPKGALGFTALDLNGRTAAGLLLEPLADGSNPFIARQALEEAECRLRAADGSARIVRVTTVPVVSASGQWRGLRGVARDVTDLARAEAREALSDAIVGALHSAVEPREMLARAASALAGCVESANAWIVFDPSDLEGFAGSAAEIPDPLLMEIVARMMKEGSDQPVVLSAGDWSGLGFATSFRNRANGAIILARKTEDALLDRDAADLLRAVAPQIGVAIAQGQAFAAVELQSKTDPLTGLMNRRGFEEAVTRRMAALARTGREAILIYVDCDNFKAVNDCLGHGAGDQLLAGIGSLLAREIRASDLAVRFGGDEFGLWLEEATIEGAVAKVEALARGFRQISRGLSLPLSVTPSVGMALYNGLHSEALSSLMARADEALYAVKRAGRNRIGVNRSGTEGGESEIWMSPCLKPC